jgi:hypothetical protein
MTEKAVLNDLVDVKGWKATGNKIIGGKIIKVIPVHAEEEPEVEEEETAVVEENTDTDTEETPSDAVEKPVSKPKLPSEDIDFEITNLNGEQGTLF